MKQFHHIKYKEINGHDELILIEHDKHNKITRLKHKNSVKREIILKSSKRMTWLRDQSHNIFQGAFCLLESGTLQEKWNRHRLKNYYNKHEI